MSFDAIAGFAEMDASGFVSGAEDAEDAMADVDAQASQTADGLLDLDPSGVAAGGALAAVGTAAQKTLDDTQAMRETLGRASVDMEITADEANALARSLSDATFPIEDATQTMDALAQQGVETEEEMRRLAEASDLIADATGTSAEAVASELAPAIRGLDGDLDALEENADAFTVAVRNTTLETEDLASTMERSQEELANMGASSDEAAALIAAYGEETGKSGRQLRRDFTRELREADGDMQAFMESTGLSEQQVSALRDEMSNGSEMTQEYADAANESLTTMDHLRAGFDDARLALAGYLGPVSGAAPAMQAMGGAGMFMATVNTGAVIPSIIGITTAMAPLLPLIIGAGAIVGGLAYAWNEGWIDPVETATWATERIGSGIDWLISKFMEFNPWIVLARELWESNFLGIQDTTASVVDSIGDFIDWLIEKINTIPGVEIGEDGAVDVAEDTVDATEEEDRRQGLTDPSSGAADVTSTDTAGEDDEAAGEVGRSMAAATTDEENTEKLIDQFVMLRNDIQSNTKAIKEIYEVTWEMALDIDDRDLERFIEDIAEASIREELQ